MVGQSGTKTVDGALASAKRFGLPHEYLSAAEIKHRFPGLNPTDDLAAVYEPEAGALNPELCLKAYHDSAQAAGAELHFSEKVSEWRANGSGVTVTTPVGEYRTDRLVITAGPWASKMLQASGVRLTVWRTLVSHFDPIDAELYAPGTCPVYIWEVPEGTYYGFPNLPGQGVKVGRHDTGEISDPETIRREITADDTRDLETFLGKYLPQARGAISRSVTCMYTNTPDRDFLIDRYPEFDNVVFGAGFSGHGFKFASAVGESLADLAVDAAPQVDLEFLSLARFSN